MADDGETKDDVKVPEGEVGEKIEKLFTTEEKDTSKSPLCHARAEGFVHAYSLYQMSLFLRLWASRLLSKPRRLPAVKFFKPPLRHRPCCQQWHTFFVCRPYLLGGYSFMVDSWSFGTSAF
jgi:hypothetical protein